MDALFYILGLFGFLLGAGLVYQAMGATLDARRFTPPGSLVDVGGYRLHIHSLGVGRPTVVLESGIAASSLSWCPVQAEVAKFARVCSYDRAGLGWSESGPSPRSIARLVQELHRLLVSASVPDPYVLVGHSFGAFTARAYASTYPSEVAALVLVDPLHPSEWMNMTAEQRRILRGGVQLSHIGALLTRLGLVRLCLTLLSGGAPGIPRQFVKVFGSAANHVIRRIIGEVTKPPRDMWPAVRAIWCQPKCFNAMADYLASLPESAATVATTTDTLGDIPLIVLAAGDRRAHRNTEDKAVAHLSSNGKLVAAQDSGHWIQLDRPDLVPLIFDFFKKSLVIWGHRGLERCAVRTASPSRGSRRLFSST